MMTTEKKLWEKLYYKIGDILCIKPIKTIIIKEKIVEKIVEIEKIVEKEIEPLNVLEKYCVTAFKEVPKFAYKDKGIFKTIRYPMYPNELIQPETRLTEKCRKEVGVKSNDVKSWCLKVGKYVDKKLKWTSDNDTDGYPDIYQDIYATILDSKQDCETHSGLVSSIEPTMGIAFGFCGKGGHAWNVFIYDNELWCLETNSVYDNNRCARVFKYSGQKKYKLRYIFTQNKTFRCSANKQHFGKLDK